MRELGPLTALVNNAGILETQMRVESMDAARLQRIFATNVTGAFICAREAVKRMSTKHGGSGGAIVNLSSRAAVLGSPGEYVDYAASKARGRYADDRPGAGSRGRGHPRQRGSRRRHLHRDSRQRRRARPRRSREGIRADAARRHRRGSRAGDPVAAVGRGVVHDRRVPRCQRRADSMKPMFFATPAAFRAWLKKHHKTADELIVGFYRKDSGKPSITWQQAVDEALCFGWIDGIRRKHSEIAYSNRFTPRRPRSNWSAINIARVEELTRLKRMQPAGLAAFAKRTEAKSRIYSLRAEGRADLRPGAGEDRSRPTRRRGSSSAGCRRTTASGNPLGARRQAGSDPAAPAGQADRRVREWPAPIAMKSKYALADYAFQFITITAGVLIALADQRPRSNGRRLSRTRCQSPRRRSLREVAANLKDARGACRRAIDARSQEVYSTPRCSSPNDILEAPARPRPP